MYLIAACLPRLRSVFRDLHTLYSASLQPRLSKILGSKSKSARGGSAGDKRGFDSAGRTPNVDLTLTNQGQLQTLIEVVETLAVPQAANGRLGD